MNDDTLIIAAEIAEWSDRMALAANKMLVRGGNLEVVELRKLITEWADRFNDVSLDIQNLAKDMKRDTEALAYN